MAETRREVSKAATIVKKILEKHIAKMREKLDQVNAVATDNLRAGIQFEVDISGSLVTGSITMPESESGNEYWAYVDKGVSGTEVSRNSPFKFKYDYPSWKLQNALEEWVADKGIPRKDKYKDKDGNYSYFGMGRKITKEGIRGTGFFTDSGTENIAAEIRDAIAGNILVNFGRK